MRVIAYILVVLQLFSCSSIQDDFSTFDKIVGNDVSFWSIEDYGLEKGHILTREVVHPNAIDVFGYTGMFIETSLTEDNFKSNVEKIGFNVLSEIKVLDSCNYFITERKSNCKGDYYPVPDFWKGQKGPLSRLDYPLNSESTFMVLDSRFGIFLENDKIIMNDGIIKVNHGYSSGLVVNPSYSTIIYWTIVF